MARMAVRLHLDTGAVLEFQAEKVEAVRNQAGALTSLNYENAVGHVPDWCDLTRVVAVTHDEPEEGTE